MSKKFLTNIDLSGNRIENGTVEIPTENLHIANKQYVDNQTLFDTENKTKQSEKFPWVNNISDKPIKEVIDKLLYPVINPEYKNPTFRNIKISNKGKSLHMFGEKITGNISFTLNNPDRKIVSDAKLKIYSKQDIILYEFDVDQLFGTTITFTDLMITDNTGYFVLVQEFGDVNLRNSSNGQPFIDNNFATNYTLEHRIPISEIINVFNFVDNIYYLHDDTLSDIPQDLLDFIDSNLTKNTIAEYINFLNIQNISFVPTLTPGLYNHLFVFIPEDLKSNEIIFELTDSENNLLNVLRYNIDEIVVKNSTSNNDYYIVLSDTGKYYVGVVNFGYPDNTIYVNIKID